jgi:CelD/BcsL family acetyltransferase involved in cellulose biosynthesis
MTATITAIPVQDVAGLEPEWRALEQQCPTLSFFQSWTWVGCLAAERYPNAMLVRAERAGRVVGLALFNRRGAALHLAESGEPVLDAPFIEHNGPLLAADAEPGLAARMFAAAWALPGVQRLVLSGVAPELLSACGGVAWRQQQRLAPFADLDAMRAAGTDHLATLSSNARYQLRRSQRALAARGKLRLERAETPAQAQAWLAALIELHQASWRQRGKPGAFADPFMRRFHETLLARAMPRHEVDLLRLSVGDDPVGYLYNLQSCGQVFAYQSGLAHQIDSPHEKPGLTLHALAIQRALEEGTRVYDFLGGDNRYKLSLASGTRPLVWGERVAAGSLTGMLARGLTWLGMRRRHEAPGTASVRPEG